MTKDRESQPNESDVRNKLLRSRPEPDTYVDKTIPQCLETPPLYNRTEVSRLLNM